MQSRGAQPRGKRGSFRASRIHANPPLPSGHPFVIVNSEYWSDTPVAQGNPGDVWTFVLDRGRTFSAASTARSTMYGACDSHEALDEAGRIGLAFNCREGNKP